MTTITAVPAGGNWGTGATWDTGVVPTIADEVILASTSGNVTVNVVANCRSLDASAYTHTLACNQAIHFGDATAPSSGYAIRFGSGLVLSGSSNLFYMDSTSGTALYIDIPNTFTWGGFVQISSGGSYKLAQALKLANMVHVNGSLDLNGFDCVVTTTYATSGALAKTIALGSNNLTIQGTGTPWANTGSNLTVSGTGKFIFTQKNIIFGGGGATYANVQFAGLTVDGTSTTINGANTFNDLDLGTNTAKLMNMIFTASQTINGQFACKGDSAIHRPLICSDTLIAPRTLTCNGTFDVQGCDFQSIVGAGSAAWNLSAVTYYSGDAGYNSGITFTTAAAQTAVSTGAMNWSDSTKWTSRVPLPQDDATIPCTSTRTVTQDIPRSGKNITFTGTQTIAAGAYGLGIFGNLDIGASVTVSGTGGFYFYGQAQNATYTIKRNGGSALSWSLNFASYGNVTWQFLDNYTLGGTSATSIILGIVELAAGVTLLTLGTTLAGGNIKLNTGSIWLTTTFSATTAATKGIDFGTNGSIQCTATTGTPFNVSGTNLICTGSGEVAYTFASATLRSLNAPSVSMTGFPVFRYNVNGSTGGLSFTNPPNMEGLTFADTTNARTLTIGITGTGLTIRNAAKWLVNGTSGKLMSIVSSASGTKANISIASGIVSSDYLSIKDSGATGGASFYAGVNSTNVSNNSGWAFTTPPLTTTLAGVARIAANLTKTVTGTAAISKNQQAQLMGISRLRVNRQTTQLGIARVAKNQSSAITGTSKIAQSTSKTLIGTARIMSAANKTLSGTAYIINNSTKFATLSGTAKIIELAVGTKTLTGISKIAVNLQKTLGGTAKLSQNKTTSISGIARITTNRFNTLSGTAKIVQLNTASVTGVSKIAVNLQKALSGTARVTKSNTIQLPGTAKIATRRNKTLSGTAFVVSRATKTLNGTARIIQNSEKVPESVFTPVRFNTVFIEGQLRYQAPSELHGLLEEILGETV